MKKKVFSFESKTDGVGDAFRHCYWSAIMTLKIGAEKAYKIGELHELVASNEGALDFKMDLKNNEFGVLVGIKSKSNKEAEVKCLEAAKSDKLEILYFAKGK